MTKKFVWLLAMLPIAAALAFTIAARFGRAQQNAEVHFDGKTCGSTSRC
jgi:hypothetical protein